MEDEAMAVTINRRGFIGASGAAVTALSSQPAAARTAALRIVHLRASQLVDPIGIGEIAPALSWRLEGSRRGIRQSAYRVQVASSLAALKAGTADLWDSGKVPSSVSTGIAYGGKALASRQRAWWRVTVWDDRNAAATAEPACWERALAQQDWQAHWLAAETPDEKADRDFGMTFFTVPHGPEDKRHLIRLPFATKAPGDVVLTLFSSGFQNNVTLDGAPLDLPPHPHDSFGGPAAARFVLPLATGAHMLALELAPPRSWEPITAISIAAQLRLPEIGGGRGRGGDGWQVAQNVRDGDGDGDGWRRAGSPEAGWVAAERQAEQPHAPWPAGPAMMMRHSFGVERQGIARLYVAALGAHDVRINGKPISPDRLQSESSDYRKTILYRTYDVSDLIRAGENVLAALVGDGWYASYMAPTGRYPFGPAPRRLIAQLEIDGKIVSRTNQEWRMAQSPILSSELYDGETYDARLEQPGWDKPGFDDTDWIACWTADAPLGTLLPQATPPVRITRALAPTKITAPTTGVTVVDMGQNFAGLAKLKVKGPAGTTVVMRFAEILKADGTVDQTNLRAARATDRYTLRGDPNGETYLPFFTFHGFRYVQVEGLPPDAWSIEGQVMGSDLVETGTLRIDNPVVQKLWLNTLWSQRSNFLAIPTDCPQRDERLGWTGDAQVFWDAAAYNMDVAAFTRRFLHDLRDAQTAKGAFPIVAPSFSNPEGASPGWADAGVMLPWICWRRYGDTSMIAEHWDAMTRYLDGIIADNPDLVWRKVFGPNFGDWLSLDAKRPGDETTPKDLVGTAMLKRSLDQVADMGAAIGKTAQAAAYRDKAREAARIFQNTFVKGDGTIGNGSQTSYILAIRCGLLTPEQKRVAGIRLAADIRRRGTLLSTGFLGTPLSLDALADSGEISLIYDLLLRTDFPSWGYMVTHGATTIWERWNGDKGDVAMNSYNHYALGAVIGFLYRRIAGIEEVEPGFARVRIAPLFDARVPSVSADYDSVRGRISVAWRQRRNGYDMDVTIPANMRAEIHLPLSPGAKVQEAGFSLRASAALRVIETRNDGVVLDIGSGRWNFGVA